MTAHDLYRQPAAPLIHSEASAASAVILALAGEVDFATSGELQQRLAELLEASDAPVVVVDMSEVRFIDAAGVGVIVSAHAAAAAHGRHLYVTGLRATPARVFELLGLGWLRVPHCGPRIRLPERKAGGWP